MIVLGAGDVVGEVAGRAARVDEDPAVPVDDAQRDEPERVRVEDSTSRKLGALRSDPSSLYDHEWYGQTMLRRLRRLAARQQFVAAVPAGVGEGVHGAVLVAGQQHAAGADGHRALRAGLGQVGGVADADPRREDVALLPGEHRRIDVRRAGQHPGLAELAQRGRELVAGTGAAS